MQWKREKGMQKKIIVKERTAAVLSIHQNFWLKKNYSFYNKFFKEKKVTVISLIEAAACNRNHFFYFWCAAFI